MFNHIRLTKKGSQNIGSTRTLLSQPLAPDFQIHVSELVHKIKILSENSKTGDISEHINNWKGLTSDKWILKTVRGAHIEIEDLDSVTLSGLSGETLLSPIKKTLFRIKIKRLLQKILLKPANKADKGYISSIFLREKKNNQHRLKLNLKNFDKHVTYRHFKMDTLTLFRMEGQKGPLPTSLSPVNSTNVGINPYIFLTFSFNPFATLV